MRFLAKLRRGIREFRAESDLDRLERAKMRLADAEQQAESWAMIAQCRREEVACIVRNLPDKIRLKAVS